MISKPPSRLVPVFPIALALVLLVGPSLKAQEPAKPRVADPGDAAAAAKKTLDPARRVPPYFGQLGLTPEQRETIYKIRARDPVRPA